jgi:hypothetical protein
MKAATTENETISTPRFFWRVFLIAVELILAIWLAQQGTLFFYQGF